VSRVRQRALVALSLAGVSALAIGVPLVALRDARETAAEDSVGPMDARLAPLRRYLAEGTRLHWFVPASDPTQESAVAFIAQYALAPAVVVAARQRDCEGGPRCELATARMVGTDVPDPRLLEALRLEFGLVPDVVTYQAVLLRKAGP